MSSESLSLFFYYALINIIAVFVLLIIGQLITRVFFRTSSAPYKLLFIRLFSALMLVVFVYAQIKANGRTVLMLLYPVMLFAGVYWWRNRPEVLPHVSDNISFRQNLFDWLKASSICIAVQVVTGIVLWNMSSGSFIVPHFDFIAYSNISNELNISGVENYHYQQFLCKGYPQQISNSLYHYPELWLDALFILITGKASVLTLFFVTVPIMITIVITGTLAIYEHYAPVNWKVVLMMILLVNASGIYLPLYEGSGLMNYWVGVLTPNFISHPKYCFSAMGIICAILLVLEQLPVYALLILLALPVVNVGHLPGVLGGGIVFLTLLYLLPNKFITRKEILYCLLCYLAFSGACYIYIATYGNEISNQAMSSNLMTDMIYGTHRPDHLKQYIIEVIRMLLRGLFLYLPFAISIPVIYLLNKEIRSYTGRMPLAITGFAIAAITVGALSTFFSKDIPDSNQLFYNNLPLLNMAIILLLIPVLVNFKDLNIASKAIILLLFILTGWSVIYNVQCRFRETLVQRYNNYSNEYISKVLAAVNTQNTLGAIWLSERDYTNMAYSYRLFYRPAPFLCLSNSFHDILDMNNYYALSNVENTALDLAYLRNTPFQCYIAAHNATPDTLQIQQMQMSFMQQNDIHYGFTKDLQNIPAGIRSTINYTLKDTVSGEYFVQF